MSVHPSVRLSHAGIVPIRLNLASHKRCRMIAQGLVKHLVEILTGSPPAGAPKRGEIRNNRRFLSTHADRQGVDISVTVCAFVRLRISLLRIKLAASYFARQFIGVQGRESPILLTLLTQKPKIGRNGQRAGHGHLRINITIEMRWCKRHARDVPFMKSRGMWT